MNNMPFSYFQPYQQPQMYNVEEEIRKLKYEIKILNERLDKLENNKTKNYLQKEEGKYMM